MKTNVPTLIYVKGGAYGAFKNRGNKAGIKVWQQAVIAATRDSTRVKGPCKLVLRFILPPDRYPSDHPYGPDVDNLAAAVLDALNETIFSMVPGKDGAVLWLEVMKLKASTPAEAGLDIIVESLPASVVTKKGADAYYLGPLITKRGKQ